MSSRSGLSWIEARGEREERKSRLAFVFAALALTISAFGLGGVHSPVLLLTLGLAIIAASLTVAESRRALPRPALVLFALSFWSAIQAVPMPLALLEVLSPNAADVWTRAFRPFGEDPARWGCLSADPGASIRECAKWFAYGGLFVVSAELGTRERQRWVPLLVLAIAVGLAAITICHALVGATRIYGFYEPLYARRVWRVAPILNPNNLAGYLNVGILTGLGIFVAGASLPRIVVAGAVAILVAVEVMTASRGGQLALLTGVLVLVGISLIASERSSLYRRSGVPRRTAWMLSAAMLGIVGVGLSFAALSANRETWAELREGGLEKLRLVWAVVPVIRDHLLFGTGRGAFETVFPAYQVKGSIIYTHPENAVAQWLVEWGVPLGALAFVALAVSCRRAVVAASRGWVRLGMVVGLGALVLQNMMDLSLELPAVACAAFLMLGSAVGPRDDVVSDRRRRARAIVLTVAGVAAVALFAIFGWWAPTASRQSLHALYQQAVAGHVGDDAFSKELRAATRRHPADPYFPRLGAALALRRGRDAMPWIQRSLERSMTYGRTHLLLAEVLHRRGATKQALMELRLAAEYDELLVERTAQFATRWVKGLDDLLRAVPDGPVGARVLDRMAVATPDTKLQVALLEEGARRDPANAAVQAALAKRLVESIGRGTCETRSLPCPERARKAIDTLERLQPHWSRALELRGALVAAEGDPSAAEDLLARRCQEFLERGACLDARVVFANQVLREKPSEVERFETAARAAYEFQCGRSSSDCARTTERLGDLAASRSNWLFASSYYGRAAREVPTRQRYSKLATAARRAGMETLASRAEEQARSFP